MRMALVLLVLASGCDDDGGGTTPDLSTNAQDMTMVAPPDMTMAGTPDMTNLAAGKTYSGNLKPGQETPAVVSAEGGTVLAVVNGAGDQVTITATFTLGAEMFMMAHVHKAAAGVAGGVVKDLPAPVAGTITATWKTSDATQPLTTTLLNDLDDGALYVNIHTMQHMAGLMRAQLVRMGETLYVARMTPGQETPPVTNAANAAGGVGYFFNPTSMKMRHYGQYSGLTGNPTMAHIHKAAVGASGGPVYFIPGLPAATSGFFKGEADISVVSPIADFDNGGLYVNIHTTLNPNGEIRGQISEKY
jgi:hypothetical protein